MLQHSSFRIFVAVLLMHVLKYKVTNTEVYLGGLPSIFSLLRQRTLRWLGHVNRKRDGRIPRDILYGELASWKRHTGRPDTKMP